MWVIQQLDFFGFPQTYSSRVTACLGISLVQGSLQKWLLSPAMVLSIVSDCNQEEPCGLASSILWGGPPS